MSNYELTVLWPAYYAADQEMQSQLQKLEGSSSPEEFDRQFQKTTMGGGS